VRRALLVAALLALSGAVIAAPCPSRNRVNGVLTTETDAAVSFDDDTRNIHIRGCDNTVAGSDVTVEGNGNVVESNDAGAGHITSVIGSGNVVVSNTAAAGIALSDADNNVVVRNVAVTGIELSKAYDNVVESNGACTLAFRGGACGRVAMPETVLMQRHPPSACVRRRGLFAAVRQRHHQRLGRQCGDKGRFVHG
jgi:hypothetical protein